MGLRTRANTIRPSGAATTNYAETWTCPSDWLSVPAFTLDREIFMLFAVWDTPTNFCAFQCTGNYTVDWGDGSAAENFAANATASHNYAYANAASLTSEGFKQVVIRIIGNSATLDNIRTDIKHPTDTNTSTSSTYGFLEIKLKGITGAMQIGGSTLTNTHVPRLLQNFEVHTSSAANRTAYSSCFFNCYGLQRFWTDCGSSVTGTFASAFRNTYSLKEVVGLGPATPSAANNMFLGSGIRVAPLLTLFGNCSNAFQDCLALVDISNLNTAGVTNGTQMFSGCRDLATIPSTILWTSLVTGTTLFENCSALKSVPAWAFPALTTMTSMFIGCSGLYEVPLFTSLTSVTSAVSVFFGCTGLRKCAALNLSSATAMNAFFSGCPNLIEVGLIVTSSNLNFSSFYSGCFALREPPALNTAAGTNFTSMHFDNLCLLELPAYSFAASGINITSMLVNCRSVKIIPAWDLVNVTTATTAFTDMRSLTRSLVTNLGQTHSYSNCQLSAASLDEIYTNLPTATKTITVSNNYGTTGDTPAIATAKNWTVTG